MDHTAKKLFIVDSGLAFNSPFPLLLRPQRAVDIYLSFDFSQRKNDDERDIKELFRELLLAEKWANQNKVQFPPIEVLVRVFLYKQRFTRPSGRTPIFIALQLCYFAFFSDASLSVLRYLLPIVH